MITRAQKVRLGLFMTVSTALLVGTLVVLAGLELGRQRDTYTVRYTTSMSGLEAGASVKYNGVRVGTVDGLRINREDVAEVIVTISLDHDTPVKKDTKAVVNMAGITGLKFIELSGGTSASEFIEPGGEIQAGESTLDKLTGRAEAIAEKAELLLNQLNKAVSDENRERVLRVVDQVDGILAENRENVKDIIANVREASLKVSEVAVNLEREGTVALQAVRQTAEGLRDALDRQQVGRIVTNVERITTSLRTGIDAADLPGLATQLKAAVASAKRALENVDLTVMRSREDLYASLQYLLEGLENFSEFARSIRENPSLLFGSKKEQEREGM